MPKCHVCHYDVHPSIGQCPHCGAPVDQPSTDLEHQVRSLLDQGRKIAAVKLYREQTGVGLAEAKKAVEAMQAGAGPSVPSDLGGDLEAELLRLLGRGDKLESIKLYKDQKGVALIEAKQVVEVLAARHGLVTQRAGCLGVLVTMVMAAVLFGMTIFRLGNP
jgi:ribosomal protein L7/L12